MLSERTSISDRLSTITVVLLAALSATLALNWHVLSGAEGATSDLIVYREAQSRLFTAAVRQQEMRDVILATLLGAPGESNDSDALAEERVRTIGDAMAADLHDLKDMPLPMEIHSDLLMTNGLGLEYVGRAKRVALLLAANRSEAFGEMQGLTRSFEASKQALSRDQEMLERRALAAADSARGSGYSLRRWLLALGLVAFVLTYGVVRLLLRAHLRACAEVRDVASALADNNLQVRTNITGSDEMKELGAAVNRMADNLQQTIEHVRMEVARGAFAADLSEAFETADSESDAYTVVRRAMSAVSPEHAMELLIADSSNAHLERAVEHSSAGAPGCPVGSPFACAAVRRGGPMVFEDGDALRACAHLRGRPCGSVSAACVPVAFMGRSLGVLHATGPASKPLSEEQISRLRALSAQAGVRIGTVRAFERTQIQASTDALTGLPNRRALEARLSDIGGGTSLFALLLGDLDHFKSLNDHHGHPAGDAALRLFAEVLTASLGPNDHAARWGGEEFCVVLAGADAEAAVDWVERLRDRLAKTIAKRSSPVFTVSFGVADSTQSREMGPLIAMADEALYQAKEEGRDRAVVARSGSGVVIRHKTEEGSRVNLRMLG